ncbi:hypothetical protein ACIQ6V_32615 [Streptomyces sp. NPDC096198]|uniref:hypothetical protein n=1 Tax=Streptomyces sp. NPDC096198 TaxID=3366080 RepID=UPI0038092E86
MSAPPPAASSTPPVTRCLEVWFTWHVTRTAGRTTGCAYDLAFFDGFTRTHEVVRHLHVLLRPGGTLLVGNLILGPDRAVTDDLTDPARWRTCPLGETALCVKRG